MPILHQAADDALERAWDNAWEWDDAIRTRVLSEGSEVARGRRRHPLSAMLSWSALKNWTWLMCAMPVC